MKYLITGVAGFIGYHLAKELSKNNIVYGIDNLNNYYSKKIKIERLRKLKKNKNIKFTKINIANLIRLKNYVRNKKFDAIIHLASQPGVQYSLKNRKSYFDNNIKSQFNLPETIAEFNLTKTLFMGAPHLIMEKNQTRVKIII